MLRSLVVLLSLVAPFSAFAQASGGTVSDTNDHAASDRVTALPCRPTIACTADLVPAGNFEVEAGYGARGAGQNAFRDVGHSGQVLLKYSLTDDVQLQLGTVGLFVAGGGTTLHAFDGVTPGVKWKFLDGEGAWPITAVSFHVDLPTSTASYEQQRSVDLEGWVYFSKDFGRLHGDLNFAVRVFDVTKPVAQGLVATSWSLPIVGPFAVFSELYTNLGDGKTVALDGGWLSGINISPVDEVIFDVGGDVGFYPGRAFTFFAGVTFVPGAHRRSAPVAMTQHAEFVAVR
jgi:hypothetical protein